MQLSLHAPDLGPLRFADIDGRVVHHRQERVHPLAGPFTPPDIADLPRADIVVSYPGADAALIHAVVCRPAAVLGSGPSQPQERDDRARAVAPRP